MKFNVSQTGEPCSTIATNKGEEVGLHIFG